MDSPDDQPSLPAAEDRTWRSGLSRRQFLKVAGGAGFAMVAVNLGLHEGYAFGAGSGGVSTAATTNTPTMA